MGEATPAQSGTFAPMLGVGLGALPGVVGGGGGVPVGGVPPPRASAVPQLHSAIVERLRARIELCRRHHSVCEGRYQREQAERAEREHESTRHLLNIVHQGPGTRKSKGGRGSNQQPPEYGRANGEQKSAEGEQKLSTRIVLQGSLRRKMEGNAPGHNPKQNGLSCSFSGSDFKRVRVDPGVMGHVTCNHNLNQSHPLQGSSASGMQRKSYMLPHVMGSDVFNMTLKEMKKEPMEIQSCGQSNSEMIFDFKDESSGQIDPELQDLFDELTKSVPPLNDLEFEKMLKQDDTFGLDLGRPSSAGATAGLCSPVEKPIKTEHSGDFVPVHGGSPQLRPASAGPSFTLTGTFSSQKANANANAQGGNPRDVSSSSSCWPKISHAQQLKQMAANQQQPSSLLHHHHHHQTMTSWAPAMSTHSSTSTFPQEKGSGPGGLSQRIGPQNKGISTCLFKSNGHTGSHQLDMKGISTKPTLHFSPKASHSTPQTLSMMPSAGSKSDPQQQPPQQGQSQTHPGLHFQNQQISTPGSLCLQNKPGSAGMPFRMTQQHQGAPPGPRLPANGSLGVMSAQSQPRNSEANNQLKSPAKVQAMQRQLTQQQHAITTPDKDNTHDQFSRHLTRPPPDYKQSRSIVGVQGNIFSGQSSSQSTSNGPAHPPTGPAPKLGPLPLDPRFGMSSDCNPGPCMGQFPQQSPLNRVGLNQSKPRFVGPNAQGKSFGMNSVQHQRGAADLHSPAVPRHLMTNVGMGWGSNNKQVTPGVLRTIPGHAYPQRNIAPPNQVAPDMGMLPLTPSIRDPSGRGQTIMGSPSAMGNLHQDSPEQRVPAGGFVDVSPNSSSYQNHRSNRLTFDFLPDGDNTVPGINADSDFIDSLLKSGSGNDDWMKDINLDEILGSHS
ncbi:LOW QUALITY PROTEIN: mastermind-like protein 2 [Menidia menidia]